MEKREEVIKNYLKEKVGLNEYRIEQEYSGLHQYNDIEEEFTGYILHGWSKDRLLTIQGYNAKILSEEFPLSILGAYNYLIYLREKPEEALEKLKKGLPRW